MTKLLLCALLVICSLQESSAEGLFGQISSFWFWTFSKECKEAVTIPDYVETIPEGREAFEGCEKLTSVKIGTNVKTIGCRAFQFSGLTTVTIPDAVEIITSFAFSACTSLATVKIGTSVKEIGWNAFESTALTTVTIPDSVEKLGGFQACQSLTTAKIGTGVKTIEDDAFSACTNLTSINIPDGVKTIGRHAFQDTAITAVTIPDSVETIGDGAFEGCKHLATVNMGTGVKMIGERAFSGTNLTKLKKPPGAKCKRRYYGGECHADTVSRRHKDHDNLFSKFLSDSDCLRGEEESPGICRSRAGEAVSCSICRFVKVDL